MSYIIASVMGLDEDFIRNFTTILTTISSGFTINSNAFEDYALSTASLFTSHYPCIVLYAFFHSQRFDSRLKDIEHAILSIGQLSEEAQETRQRCEKIQMGSC